MIKHYCLTFSVLIGSIVAVLPFGILSEMELWFTLINLSAIAFICEFAQVKDCDARRSTAGAGAFLLCVANTAFAVLSYSKDPTWCAAAAVASIAHCFVAGYVIRQNFWVEDDRPGRQFDGEFFRYDVGRYQVGIDPATGDSSWSAVVYWCPECNHLIELIDCHPVCIHCAHEFQADSLPGFKGVPESHRAMLEQMSPATMPKPSNAAKRVLPALLALLLVGCGENQKDIPQNTPNLKTWTHDGHQFVVYHKENYSNAGVAMLHHPSCPKCILPTSRTVEQHQFQDPLQPQTEILTIYDGTQMREVRVSQELLEALTK